MTIQNIHTSVLLNESVSHLNLKRGDIAIDCTAGRGGHSSLILKEISPGGKLICLDRDTDAIDFLKLQFASEIKDKSLLVIKSPFSKVKQIAEMLGLSGKISGILADIGVSSPQIDEANRGFSFMKDGPLDMRMDQSASLTAADIVNQFSERELQLVFQEYGEEKYSKRIAKHIVKHREKTPITSTLQLAQVIKQAVPTQAQQKHPATRVFQALRIQVNDELSELKSLLHNSFEILKPSGRLAIVTFHSLEDRIVKNFFKGKTSSLNNNPLLKDLPILNSELSAEGKIIKPFPITPSEEEILRNVRARSAKLRVIEKNGKDDLS